MLPHLPASQLRLEVYLWNNLILHLYLRRVDAGLLEHLFSIAALFLLLGPLENLT